MDEQERKLEQSKIHARRDAIYAMSAIGGLLVVAVAVVLSLGKDATILGNALTFVLGLVSGLLGAPYLRGGVESKESRPGT